MSAGTRKSTDAARLWLAILCLTYALALPQILSITPAVLKNERLATLAAPLVTRLGLASLMAGTSAPESAQWSLLMMTIVLISYLHLKLSLLQDERNCLNAFQEAQEKINAQNRQRELEAQAERSRWVEREKARLRKMEDDWREQMEKARLQQMEDERQQIETERKMDDLRQSQIEAAWQHHLEEVRTKEMGETQPLEVELRNQSILLTQEASVPINRSMAVLRRDRDTRQVLKRINEADQLGSLFQSDDATVMADNICLPPCVRLERASSGSR